MKRILSVFLTFCMIFVLVYGTTFSANAAASGTAGSCQWSLEGTVLTISGNGNLYVNYGNAPWGKSITEVKINEGVTSIGAGTFSGSTALKKVTLPSTLKTLEYGAFEGCTSLITITLPDSLTTIDSYTFARCTSLIDITIPQNVNYLGYEVFEECYSLKNIFVDPESKSFTSVDGVLFSKDKTVLVRYPSEKGDRYYSVPDGVREISWGAFEAAWNLMDITLPDSVRKIGPNAFYKTIPYNDSNWWHDGCMYIGNHLIIVKNENMTTCNVREGTISIADSAFAAAKKLKEVVLPEGLVAICENAFSWCTALESIYIPSSVTTIENSAFYDCTALKNILYSGTSADRAKITVGTLGNDKLKSTAWNYNSCLGGKDHEYTKVVVIKTETCTEAGEKKLTCSVCGATTTEKPQALGHEFSQWSETKKSTCASAGEEQRKCDTCGVVETRSLEVLGHVYGPWSTQIEASCDDVGVEKRVCTLCDDVQARNINPKGHKYSEGITTKKPTFTKTGLKEEVCEVCGDVIVTTLDAIDPTIYIIVAVDALLVAAAIVLVIVKKKRTTQKEQ